MEKYSCVVRVSKSTHRTLKAEAAREGFTLSEFVDRFVATNKPDAPGVPLRTGDRIEPKTGVLYTTAKTRDFLKVEAAKFYLSMGEYIEEALRAYQKRDILE